MKVVVSGVCAAGKTQFIKTISEIDVVSTERKFTGEEFRLKGETTTDMDFGRITVDDNLVLHLFSTPGQRRFDFMWAILAEGMLGFVILVDSCRPETFRETTRMINAFLSFRPAPFVVAATKQDVDNAWSPEDIRISLGLEQKVKVLPCVAIDKESIKNVLLELLNSVLEEIEKDDPLSA